MGNAAVITILLIVANVLFSWKGFKNSAFFDSYKFEIDPILVHKDYKRMITSGFLHANWLHLIMNMYVLFSFGSILEMILGWPVYLIIYFASLIGGNLLALFVHRHHSDYNAIGASGAVSGVVFATIALFPNMNVFFLPGWLFAIIYVGASIYGIKTKKGNIGHDAHLGGALIGMIVAILFNPQILLINYIPILLITIPAIVFIVLIASKPHILIIDGIGKSKTSDIEKYTIDQRFNADKNQQQQEIDRILDKINRKGANSLTEKEKETLKEFTR